MPVITMVVTMRVVVVTMVVAMVVVATMLIMHMTMSAVIVMAVIMMAVIVMRMSLRLMGSGIGAAFGIEWRLDLDHARAEPAHHLLDDMIATDAQAFGHDLRRQMAIAEMPGEPHEVSGIAATDLDQRLGCRHNFDAAAVFQHQRIAAAQGDGVFEVEQEFQSARPRHRHAAAMPIVEIENDGVDRGFDPVILADDGSRADHG
jgi:hypothetical protein